MRALGLWGVLLGSVVLGVAGIVYFSVRDDTLLAVLFGLAFAISGVNAALGLRRRTR